MKWILLPGFDGTGKLFAPLLRVLPPGIEPVVVAYPCDRPTSVGDLDGIVLGSLPTNEPYVLIAESFSGPIGLKAASLHRNAPAAIILCASFVECPFNSSLVPIFTPFAAGLARIRPPHWMVRRYLLNDAKADLVELFYAAIAAVSPRVLANRFSSFSEFDESFAPPGLNVPMLYLKAEDDRLVPSHNFGLVQQKYPHVKIARIKSPHLILQVRPEASIAAIIAFCLPARIKSLGR
jgi:pimeloyl-ACP methyl ester carboxylesterase